MSGTKVDIQARQVAAHYDDLDTIYRKIWGENLHHGLWVDGVRSAAEAGRRMTDLVGENLDLRPGERLFDVGCGYGRMAADLARRFGVAAEGMTLSRKQWEQAVPGVEVSLGDWLENRLPDEHYEALVAVESLEHMADPQGALAQMARVMKPAGRAVLCCWLVVERPSWLEQHLFLNPIRRAGRLGGMTNERNLRRWIEAGGLKLMTASDLSREVAGTWSSVLWRGLMGGLRDSEYRRAALAAWRRSDLWLISIRIRFAYHIGVLRYLILTVGHPD
ncbi:SAM-dependent methyltransferase [Haloferula sp.]|uniref:SAM-dependent methyltransferase n=1 Tax=Haloferula sp. TaxID=2497595 RepID=UPI003C740E09